MSRAKKIHRAREAQDRWSLSWESAQEEAGKWIAEQHLSRDLTGQVVDLSQATLPFEGNFRAMVLEAVRRKLRRRGAREILLPPP